MSALHATGDQPETPTAIPVPGGAVVMVAENGEGPYGQLIRVGDHTLIADEPAPAGGGAGPGPYELLLAALGACTSMTVRMYADRKRWPLEQVTVSLRHHRDTAATGQHSRVDQISRDIRLDGDLDTMQRQRLIEIANGCPVHRTLTAGADIITTESTPLDHTS
ncbi:OsmC family protein [Nocardia sp. NBC_00511]|uniref:OsmC family protein n=1 Tax=Nocardia sp. NBC_00511 TaxID=2903591 RepID=UPI0030E32185